MKFLNVTWFGIAKSKHKRISLSITPIFIVRQSIFHTGLHEKDLYLEKIFLKDFEDFYTLILALQTRV